MDEIKIHKATLSAELEKELIKTSALWESENSCYGYRETQQKILISKMYLSQI